LAKILIVDDDPAVHTTIRLLLDRAGRHFGPDALLQTVAACLEDAKRSSSSRAAGNIASSS
jgi:CheY-like chemotaxis protein